jgi:hypothetical protein
MAGKEVPGHLGATVKRCGGLGVLSNDCQHPIYPTNLPHTFSGDLPHAAVAVNSCHYSTSSGQSRV